MDDSTLSGYTQQNRRAWNEIAQVRARIFPPAAFFAEGGSTLDTRVVDAARGLFSIPPDTARPFERLRAIHLQCATGEDTLSWSVLGADAVGVDISDEQVVIANRKARDAGLSTRFYAADIYDLPGALSSHERAEGFDIVFTGGGALVWLPDILRWSQVVFALLKPGGHLLLIEEHPVSGCLWVHDGQIVVETDYFGRSKPFIDTGWAHFKGGEDAHEIKNEFAWPLGDVVTALCGAGMVIERLEEFPGGPEWRFGERQEDSRRLPGEYLLLARRPA